MVNSRKQAGSEGLGGAANLEIFDHAVRDANLWISQLSAKLPGHRRSEAYFAFRAVLHAIRDHVGQADAIRLGTQLPTILRGIYYEGWMPAECSEIRRADKSFVDMARGVLCGFGAQDPDRAVRCVLDLLSEKLDLYTLKSVKKIIPRETRPRTLAKRSRSDRECDGASYRTRNEAS